MKLLVVEDNEDLREALAQGLAGKGFEVEAAHDGRTAVQLGTVQEYDAIILDIGLPDIDGFEVLRFMRMNRGNVPVLALTARGELKDKVKGLRSGFDDYMTKPLDFLELSARIDALIRRTKSNSDTILKVADIELQPKAYKVTSRGNEVFLTKAEFRILEYMIRNAGFVVTPGELIDHLWDDSADLVESTIRTHIKNLRKKLGDENFTIIRTLPGIGYTIGT